MQVFRYAIAVALFSLPLAGAAQKQPDPGQKNRPDTKQQSQPAQAQKHVQSEGERIFVQNCARCHTPPDGFSSRISGTIVLHMRVRASLSDHDAHELMRYFNP